MRLPHIAVAVAIVLSGLVSIGPISADAGVTEVSPAGAAKEVSFYFPSPTNHRRALQLELFPGQGVAVVSTYERADAISGRKVSYAIAVPPVPFDGRLDLEFPGLGDFVGTVTPDSPPDPRAQAKLCESDYPEEAARFRGHFAFRGAGNSGSWVGSTARAGITLACGVEPKRENDSAALFGHVAELGPSLAGPAPIRFLAHGEVRHRILEFIAWGGGSPDFIEFVAIDREWLPGRVATERWVKKSPASLKKTVAFEVDAAGPSSVTFTPPAPFFGKGVYRRRTGKLTGSLGVGFSGLKLRLAPSPLPATLMDDRPHQAF